MPSLAQIRNRVDDWLADKWVNVIRPRQDAYFAAHNRYFQGLTTHNAVPDSGTDWAQVIPDNLGAKPSDQAETWADVFPEIPDVPIDCAIAFDVYDGPQGKGFVGHVWAARNGTIYHRAKGFGSEQRDQDWAEQ